MKKWRSHTTSDKQGKQAAITSHAEEQAAHKRNPYSKKCGNKLGYVNRAMANGSLSVLRAKLGAGKVRLQAYHCQYCGLFHFGNPIREKGSDDAG